MAASASSSRLMKVLTTPSKIANALDWRKMTGSAVLSLDIHADRIGLAVAGHPSSIMMTMPSSSSSNSSNSSRTKAALPLDPLPLERKGRVSDECKQRLAELVRTHNVCGFVVSWPVQQDTGRMGAGCGRTLYILDQLLSEEGRGTTDGSDATKSPIMTPSRPVCLWDAVHSQSKQPTVDSFGRSVAYSLTEPTGRSQHVASREQYHQDETTSASQVWEDFCRQFWPETVAVEARVVGQGTRSVYQEPQAHNDVEYADNEGVSGRLAALALA